MRFGSIGGDNLPSVPEAAQSKQYAWQPRSTPMAEPMASALRRAAESRGKKPSFESPAISHGGMPQGRQAEPRLHPLVPGGFRRRGWLTPRIENRRRRTADTPARLHPTPFRIPLPAKAGRSLLQRRPYPCLVFASVEGQVKHASGAGGTKKTLLVAVVLLGVAAAGYFGWTKKCSLLINRRRHNDRAPQKSLLFLRFPASSLTQDQSATPRCCGAASTAGCEHDQPDRFFLKPSAAVLAEAPGSKALAANSENRTFPKHPRPSTLEPSQPLVVRRSSHAPKVEARCREPEQAPALTSIAPDTNNAARPAW